MAYENNFIPFRLLFFCILLWYIHVSHFTFGIIFKLACKKLQQQTVSAIQIRIELGNIKCINKIISKSVNVFHIHK